MPQSWAAAPGDPAPDEGDGCFRAADGRPLRMLVVLNECTGERLAIEVGTHCRGEDMVRVLDELTAIRCESAHSSSDNGPEFGSSAVRKWREACGAGTLDIDPGVPRRNGNVESFSGRLQDEQLSSEIVATLNEARLLVDRWQLRCKHRRIQRVLGKLTIHGSLAACPALPPLRQAAVPPGTEGVATIRCFS